MKNEEKSTYVLKITLKPEELEILKEYAALQKRPVAGAFMDFVREANTFEVLGKVNSAGRKIQKFKSFFKRDLQVFEAVEEG